MAPELATLTDRPELLVVAIGLAALAGMWFERLMARMHRQAWRNRRRRSWSQRRPQQGRLEGPSPWTDQASTRLADPADQLRIVMGARFTTQPLLNRTEARVFKELDPMVTGRNPGWQVMAQVSLGEILSSPDADAYRCINSKRVDLLLVDGNCQARHVIECQGHGHHQGTAAARDAVKKEALRRAGIGYHEVIAGRTTPADLRRLVEKLVDKPKADETRPKPEPRVVSD